MKQVTVHEAKTQLSKLIRMALCGEEVVIARRDQPVVRLQPVRSERSAERVGFGCLRGLITQMAPDFDAPLDDFREYMETNGEAKR